MIDLPNWLVPVIGIVANLLLVFGSHGLATRLVGRGSWLFVVLGTGTIYWSLIIIGLEALGSVGMIGPLFILAFGSLVFGIGLIARQTAPLAPSRELEPSREVASTIRWDARICVGLLWMSCVYLGTRSLFNAVKVVSDGPIYHLYFAVRWWKAGRLFLIAAPFGENAATYFPANGDLWFTWLLTSWGSERLAKLGQAPFLLLALLAVWAGTRILRLDRSASLVALCCFGISTPLLLFSFEPNVDTIFAAGYLVAAAFFLRHLQDNGGPGELILGALAAGAALGTKAVGVVFLPPLLAWIIVVVIAQQMPIRRKLVNLAVVLCVPIVTCGYWFLQNLWLTGNPLYPLNVEVWGHTLLSGWYGRDAMRFSPFFLEVSDWRALGDILASVLDPRLIPFWLAALLFGWTSRRAESPATRGAILAFAVLAVINVGCYWLFIPYRTQQRFMLQAVGLAVVPLAAILGRHAWLRLAASLAVALHVLTPQPWPWIADNDQDVPWDLNPRIPNVVAAVIPLFSRLPFSISSAGPAASWIGIGSLTFLILVCCLAAWTWFQTPKLSAGARARHWLMVVGVTLGSLLVGAGDLFAFAYDPRLTFYYPFRDFFIGWMNFDHRSGPSGARVAYAGTNIPYYLLGNGLRNEVRYVNVDRHRDWLPHDYHREAMARGEPLWPNPRPGWDRIHPVYDEWLANLEAEKIQLLVVTHVNADEGAHNVADTQGFPIERQWAETHPDRFEPLYGVREQDPQFRIYRVLRPADRR